MKCVFDWSFHIACNYRCSYCYFDGRWNELAKSNLVPPMEKVINSWKRVHEKYGESLIQMCGGEPTVYPGFTELIRRLSEWHVWHFNTNLSWSLSQWESFSEVVDPSRCRMGFSFHPSQKVDLSDFIRKAAFLKESGFGGCEVCFVAHPPQFEMLKFYRAEFEKCGLKVRTQPFVGTFDGRDYPAAYSKEEKRLMKDANQETNSSILDDLEFAMGNLDPFGKLCRSGQIHALIDRLGDVYRCTQVPLIAVNKIGNLYEGFELFSQPAPCPLHFCRCGESRFLVEKDEEEARLPKGPEALRDRTTRIREDEVKQY